MHTQSAKLPCMSTCTCNIEEIKDLKPYRPILTDTNITKIFKVQSNMRTNLFKIKNIIRCVSVANLNLFRYTAMVAMLLMLGVGNAWAHSNHTGKVTLVNATGNGTVYLSAPRHRTDVF